MKTLVLFFFLLIAPAIAKAQVTKPVDLVSAHYTILLSPDRDRYGEGIFVTYEMANKRTRIGIGFNHTKIDETLPNGKLSNISIGVTGEVANFPVDLDIGLDGITYASKRSGSLFDIILLGEYNYFNKIWSLKEGNYVRKTHGFSLWAGVGSKIDVSIENTEYSLYVDGELFDTLENPLSHSKTSGIKFLLSHGINYRFSMMNVGVHTMISIPTIKKSLVLFSFGFSI